MVAVTSSAVAEVPTITDGHFFYRPGPLPRGRHPLERAEVLRAQSERLMIAATELGAAFGYRSIGVREIAGHARVSRAAFYECFADKDACIFAAYDRFIEVLLDRVIAALVRLGTWEDTVSGTVDAYLDTLSHDLVVARAFQVEMDALGREARERRRLALTGMARLLKERRDELWPGAEHLSLSAYSGAVYAVRQLASDLLDASPTPDLVALSAEIRPVIAVMLQPH